MALHGGSEVLFGLPAGRALIAVPLSFQTVDSGED
jgi:hypothetical protein